MTFSLTTHKPDLFKNDLNHPLKYKGHEAALPSGYATNRLIAMVRDPYWLFCYWDFDNNSWETVNQYIKQPFFLRLLTEENELAKIPINPQARSWYINTYAPGKTISLELVVCTASGFLVLLKSNLITMPTDSVSSFTDELWLSINELYSEKYCLSLGGSPHYWQNEAKREEAHYLASPIPQLLPSAKDHYLWLDTELIIYGKTTPDAVLLQNDQVVALDPEGQFQLHFKLNDGKQSLNFESYAKNGLSKTKALTVERSLQP